MRQNAHLTIPRAGTYPRTPRAARCQIPRKQEPEDCFLEEYFAYIPDRLWDDGDFVRAKMVVRLRHTKFFAVLEIFPWEKKPLIFTVSVYPALSTLHRLLEEAKITLTIPLPVLPAYYHILETVSAIAVAAGYPEAVTGHVSA